MILQIFIFWILLGSYVIYIVDQEDYRLTKWIWRCPIYFGQLIILSLWPIVVYKFKRGK